MISAILLAAGQSKRFKNENKLTKVYKNKPLINHILSSLIRSEINKFNRHIGVYAFRKNTLINFSSLNRSKNEISENLEGNRAIDNSIPVKMIKIDFHGISIDTEKDFIDAEKYLSRNA